MKIVCIEFFFLFSLKQSFLFGGSERRSLSQITVIHCILYHICTAGKNPYNKSGTRVKEAMYIDEYAIVDNDREFMV